MTDIQHLANLLNIDKFTDNYTTSADLEISEYMTADGYDLHIVTNDSMHLQFDLDVYQYIPSLNDIIERIKDLDSDAVVYVSDFETYLPEYEVQDYIEQHKDNEDDE